MNNFKTNKRQLKDLTKQLNSKFKANVERAFLVLSSYCVIPKHITKPVLTDYIEYCRSTEIRCFYHQLYQRISSNFDPGTIENMKLCTLDNTTLINISYMINNGKDLSITMYGDIIFGKIIKQYSVESGNYDVLSVTPGDNSPELMN